MGVKTMPFVKGDPNINRNGRPKNAEPELLRQALAKEGARRGESFWDKVASYAFTDKNVMVAVIKKFIPDMTNMQLEGDLQTGQKVVVIVKEKDNERNENTGEGRGLPASVSVIPS